MFYSDEIVRRFARLFRCREVTHGQYWPPESQSDGEKRVKTVHGPVEDAQWRAHLAGQLPFIGSCPIMQDNVCYWGALDLDDDNVDHVTLEANVRSLNLPLVVCRSKSGGAHLFVFFSEPVPAKLAIEKLKEWKQSLGLKNPLNKQGKSPEVEVFPKQHDLKPSNDGNWVNLPYWNAAETIRFALHDGNKLSLEEFLAHAENTRISEATLRASRAKSSASSSSRSLPIAGDASFNPDDPFADGPPCMQTLHSQGWTEGGRNASLFNIALFLRLADADTWQDDVREFNKTHFDPPLPEGEVDLLVMSVERHPDYVYRCSDVPLEPVCQKSICKKRRFGIKAFTDMFLEKDFPVLSELVKVNTDPPLWRVKVNDTVVEVPTDDLLFLARFRKIVLEKNSLVVPFISQMSWDIRLRKLLTDMKTEDVPEDAGVRGEFNALMTGFLALRKNSRNWDAILLGKPYQEEDEVYFRSQDLVAYLRRKNFREYTTSRVYSIIKKDMNGSHGQKKIGGALVRVWIVPAPNDGSGDIAMPKSGRPNF